MFEKIIQSIDGIRRDRPLILNLTNLVTMDFIANGLLALGAAPIMSQANEELEEMVALANVVVINIGTLDPEFINRAKEALQLACRMNKIVVLDPVGAGASAIRTRASLELLTTGSVAIIRGNASEILALSGEIGMTQGVETTRGSEQALKGAKQISHANKLVVTVSGATDIIVQQGQVTRLSFGTPLMTSVTGMGCLLTSVIAAFHTVNHDPFQASLLATAFYNLCGEEAVKKAKHPGSFKMAFLDALYAPDQEFLERKLSMKQGY